MKKSFFRNKRIVITGGTGSIGSSILKHLIPFSPKKITIFSRDEYKQYQLKFAFPEIGNTEFEYILGDVRDVDSLVEVTKKTDILFHCAALKHVPQSEDLPAEFIKTNVLGALNIKKAASFNHIPLVVSISSDKAVNPSNVMGLTKALQEKVFTANHRKREKGTRFINVRFGNVIGTKGSLFPILYHQILNNQPLTITNRKMTRFFMTKKEAIDLIFWAAINGKDGETIVKSMHSALLGNLVRLFLEVAKKKPSYPMREVGVRVGEKMHESLLTEDEAYRVERSAGFYVISPYSGRELKHNLITTSNNTKLDMEKQLRSDNPQNHFTNTELKKLIKEYISHIDDFKQIL